MVVSSDQIVYMNGKEKGLQKLFSQENFGYLAIGYSDDPAFSNDDNNNGFNEIKINICDVNFIKRRLGVNQTSAAFQVTEKNLQIKIVSGNSFV